MQNQTGTPGVTVHALEVHDAHGNHLRTMLQPGGRYWPPGGEPHHPVHGAGDDQDVIERDLDRELFGLSPKVG